MLTETITKALLLFHELLPSSARRSCYLGLLIKNSWYPRNLGLKRRRACLRWIALRAEDGYIH